MINPSSLLIGSQLGGPTCNRRIGTLTQPRRRLGDLNPPNPTALAYRAHGHMEKVNKPLPAWQVSSSPLPLPPHPHNPPPFSPHPVTPPPKTLILPVVQTHTLSLPRYPSEAHRRSSSFPAVGSVTGVARGMTHCSAARPAGHTEWAGYIFAGSHDTLKQTGEEIL